MAATGRNDGATKVEGNLALSSDDSWAYEEALFLSSASFWRPDRIERSGWVRHTAFAFWIIDALRPRVIVELGTHSGFSYLSFCQAVQRLELSTRCYAIDHWQGDEHAGFYDAGVYQRLSQYHDARYDGFSRLMRSTFDEALEHFIDGSIDLLHIDGRHYYHDVRHDFDAWRPKLSESAIVLFHDTNVREDNFGVFKLWNELCAVFPHFEFIHGHGLGILGVGTYFPKPVQQLFLASSNEGLTKNIRNIYARLGSAASDQLMLEEYLTKAEYLKSQATHRNADIEKLKTEILQLVTDNEKLKSEILQRNADIEKLSILLERLVKGRKALKVIRQELPMDNDADPAVRRNLD